VPQALKIFISSPGDVVDERRRAALVIGRLKREFARFFDLSAVLWEYEPMVSSGHFQDIIEPPSDTDIMVLILWSRLGTPLPEKTATREYRGLDGNAPVTGTEWEFEQALDSQRKRGVPDVLVYRKQAEGMARFSRAEQLDLARQQWQALQGFWERYFEGPDGSFKAAFNRFETLDAFEALLEQHLRELLRRRLSPQGARAAPGGDARIDWWAGSPYLGLRPFDREHATVFFGRERAEREITEALLRRAEEGSGFILVLGASGSGKSSLVRAGLVPDLMAPGVVSGVSSWRCLVITPADLLPDPFAGLAKALLGKDALPELAAVGYRETEVAAQLRSGGALASVPLRLALERVAAEDARAPSDLRRARLVLVLDQMEALFTSAAISDEARKALDSLFAELARSGLVWVIATMRSDFFHRLVEMPEVADLAKGLGQFHLAPANAAEIEQIITRPAEVAGLSFEIDQTSGIGLAAVIRDAAARDPGSLPLLSFVLDELYRRDIEAGGRDLLTYRSYLALGGLEGAIARHAETLIDSLGADLAAALPGLLLALVEIDEIAGTATARTVRRAAFTEPAQAELADRLVAARLVIVDGIEANVTLRVAHEALLAHWPRLARLIEEHRDFLIMRRRLQSDAAAWHRAERHPDFLLPPGRRLAEAQELLATRAAELGHEIVDYAEASSAADAERLAALQRQKEEGLRRELRRSRRIAAIVSVFLLAALVAGGIAWIERNSANKAAEEAAIAYGVALKQAAGNVRLLVDAHKEGAISTDVMQRLMEQAQATVNGLPRESNELTVARAQLMDVLSLAFVTIGDASTGQRFAESAAVLANRLLASSPKDPQLRQLWVEAQGRLGEALFWKGNSTEALPVIRTAIQAAQALTSDRPDDPQVQRVLLEAYARHGDILKSLGDLEGAAVLETAWIERVEDLAKRQPENIEWLAALAAADIQHGQTLRQLNKLPEAAARYQAAVAISAKAVAQDPRNASYLEALTVSHEFYADVLMAQENLDEALAEFQIALGLAERLADGDSANFLWREIVEALHQRVGEVRLQRNEYAAALAEFAIYEKLTSQTLARAPTNGSLLYDETNALEKIGDALRAQGDLEGALAKYQESLKIAAELNSRGLGNHGWAKILAMSYQRLGMTQEAREKKQEALAQYRLCQTIPVDKFVWTPRTLWPADVTEYCREAAARLGGSSP
jgi:eukaryotic-like serine/threonine-protein kinase